MIPSCSPCTAIFACSVTFLLHSLAIPVFNALQVDISLTEEGQERWEEVVALVHSHARLLRNITWDQTRRVWQETRDMAAIQMRFQQARSPSTLFSG